MLIECVLTVEDGIRTNKTRTGCWFWPAEGGVVYRWMDPVRVPEGQNEYKTLPASAPVSAFNLEINRRLI